MRARPFRDRPVLLVLLALLGALALIVIGQAVRPPAPGPAPSAPTEQPTEQPSEQPGEVGSDSVDEPAELDERLYEIGDLAATDCADPRVRGTGDDQLAEFADGAVDDCLMPAWAPALERVGVELQRPRTEIVSDDSITTDCGEMSNENQVIAFYCTENQTIYLFAAGTTTFAERAGWLPMAVLAHEFGHHVQNATDSWPITDDDTTDRRIELQAECLAGVWFHDGQDAIDGFSLDLVVGRYVSNDTHGSVAVRSDWFMRGFESGNTDDCRSYTADSDDVS